MTVGLSEIPILVAAFRLSSRGLERDGRLPGFSVLCRDDTTDEARRVHDLLEARLRSDGLLGKDDVLRWTQFVVPHAKGDAIRQATANLIKLQPRDCTFHLHYTGGSRAMSVHAMEALATHRYEDGSACDFETSFLPSGENVIVQSRGPSTTDERWNWCLPLSELAQLNCFTSDFYSTQCSIQFSALPPDPDLVDLGCEMFNSLRIFSNRQAYADWLHTKWSPLWTNKVTRKPWTRWPQSPPKDYWPVDPVPWLAIPSDPNWDTLSSRIRSRFGGCAIWRDDQIGWTLLLDQVSPHDLGAFNQFLQYQCFELFTYRSLTEALKHMGLPKWNVYHGARVARTMLNGRAQRDFELDVVAVLGYQLLVISCSMSSEHGTLKRKAFEVLHRAKQVGGTGARSVLVCALSAADALSLMRDVEEDAGPRESNLEIWGIDIWDDLQNRIVGYLMNSLMLSSAAPAKAVV